MMELFHAKHKTETKERILTSFEEVGSANRVLLSTVAFGMGFKYLTLMVSYIMACRITS